MQPVDSEQFYSTYFGHLVDDLTKIHRGLRSSHPRLVFLAGDSSLDNKHWVRDREHLPATNGYEFLLLPPACPPDVCYWLNDTLSRTRHGWAALNTAVEATTLRARVNGDLFPQDVFIRDHLRREDALVVSIGANDIALAPTSTTMFHLASLVLCPRWWVRRNPSFWYFVRMFKDDLEKYLHKLTERCTPRRIMVCMIYFPCEVVDENSWSRTLLRLACYNVQPGHLQRIIRMLFEEATCQVTVPGSEVVPIPLFDVLDSRNKRHYIERVEPSAEGGRKIAEYLAHWL